VKPRIVVGLDQEGGCLFILPFQVRRRLSVRVLEWLGAPHINYGYGLYDPGFLLEAPSWFAANFARVLQSIGDFDLVALADMPETMHGLPHPLQSTFRLLGPNKSYAMALQGDYEALYAAKRSGESRRSSRKRDYKLEQAGDVWFGLPAGQRETQAVLDDMFEQQDDRLAESGVHQVFGSTERAFVKRLADVPGLLAPYHLKVDGKTVSVMLGGVHHGTYWALISSLAPGPLRKFSPGDAALRRMIEACCKAGLSSLDFAAGETSYKPHWADQTIPLHVSIQARGWRGLAAATVLAAAITAKGAIKRNANLRAAGIWLRRILFGKAESGVR
jgi:CelD/BcsL family acetyltransferase involved in cellulose biosynthesis